MKGKTIKYWQRYSDTLVIGFTDDSCVEVEAREDSYEEGFHLVISHNPTLSDRDALAMGRITEEEIKERDAQEAKARRKRDRYERWLAFKRLQNEFDPRDKPFNVISEINSDNEFLRENQ